MITVFGPAPAGAVTIPASALTSLGGKSVVFVRTRTGFAARQVVTGGKSGSNVVILSGIAHGDRIAATGTSELKSLAGAE
jgi:cobalt-zinc-cadmium efflux system membrane fusion protein